MWDCNYMPLSGGWWGGFFPHSPLSLLLWALIFFLLVCLTVRKLRPQGNGAQGSTKDRLDSQAILKARFARGEISRDDFVKMREILSQP